MRVETTQSGSPCVYEISESASLQPPIHDIDPLLFPGANVDLKPASAPLGTRIFVVGKRTVNSAVNGKRYSRALAAATLHYYRVTCGSEIANGQFITRNPPLGNSYPELPPFDGSAFGNLADPTIDWVDPLVEYIDPLTGIKIKRVTGPGQAGYLTPPSPFDIAIDIAGAWTNPQAATRKQAGGLASTSKPNAPLFLAWNEIHNYQLNWSGANFNPMQGTLDDLRIRLTGTGPAVEVSMCISLDGGRTCSGSTLSTVLSDSAVTSAPPVPTVYPKPMFAGWGRVFSNWELANRGGASGASAAVGSKIVTAAPGTFNVDWPVGIRIKLEGSGCNGNDLCTLAFVQNTGRLILAETVPKAVDNRAWQAYPAGIRLWLSSGSRVSLNATYEYAESTQNIMNDNPNQSYCSELKVNDIYTDATGKPLASPLSGRLCQFGHGLYLAVDGTGEFRLLSNLYMSSRSPLPHQPVSLSTSGAFSGSDPKTFYGNSYYNPGIYRGTYTGDYSPYRAGGTTGYISSNPADDAVTWTNIVPDGSPADVSVQLQSMPGLIPASSSLLGQPAFNGILGGFGMFFTGPFRGTDPICEVIRYNLEQKKIQQVLNSWSTWPMRWGGCHFSPHGGGTFQIGAFNPINGQDAANPLNGPFQLTLKQVKKGGVWSDNTSASESVIASASNSSPIVVSTASTYTDSGYMGSNPHGLIDGEPVVIWGAESNTVLNTPANASYYVKASWSDTSLANALGATDSQIFVGNAARLAPNPMLRIDSELIRCAAITGNRLTGCARGASDTAASAHAAGAKVRQVNSFALFKDPQLSQPVAGNGVYLFNSKTFVMDLDVCPASLDSRFLSAMIGDSGASGRRCTTFRVAGEPFSRFAYWTTMQAGQLLTSITVKGGVATVQLSKPFPGWRAGEKIVVSGANNSSLNGTFSISKVVSGKSIQFAVSSIPAGVYNQPPLTVKHPTEHYQYPFKGDPENLNLSSLQDLQPGDFIHDLAGGQFGEQLVVVQKRKNSETDIELTVMRFWGNKWGCDKHLTDSSPMTHSDGWTPFMAPSFGCWAAQGYADIGDSAWRIGNYHLAEEHGDIGPGSTPGLYTYVSSGGNTPLANVSFNQIMTAPVVSGAIAELPTFGAPGVQLPYGYTTQGYGAFRQTTAPAQEKVWKADYHALNNSFGAGQDIPIGLTTGMTFGAVAGTSTVYRVTGMPSGLDRKRLPLLGFAGYHYLSDISGPGSLISDANPYRFCVADFAGECRPGSTAGTVYLSVPGADFLSGGWCITNNYEHNAPCLFTPNSYGGWAVQQQIAPPDATASHGRRLTNAFLNPGRHFSFSNWVPSPDGQWGFLSPPWLNGVRNDVFAMKLPPWPASDNVNRADFVPLAVPVSPLSGAISARALFGYAENGPPESFYCGQRQEACVTGGKPYSWLSENPPAQFCASGCTLSIPAIAGRILYYRVEWLDGAGRLLYSGPLNAASAAP